MEKGFSLLKTEANRIEVTPKGQEYSGLECENNSCLTNRTI